MGKRSSASEADAAAGGGSNKKIGAINFNSNRSIVSNTATDARIETTGPASYTANHQAIEDLNNNINDASSNNISVRLNHIKTASKNKHDIDKKVTKRQRRKQLQQSEKNKWPQHPHLKTSAARDQAYLRVAGLAKSKAKEEENDKKKQKALDDDSNMVVEMRWGRCLASTEARTRHAAVQQLQNYLRAKCHPESGGGISELDLLKLCKALWYTLYLADHAVVQQELSQRLAELLWCLAGTEEEDEYAGQAYMEMLEEEEAEELDEYGDDYDVIMEIVGEEHDDVDGDEENKLDEDEENVKQEEHDKEKEEEKEDDDDGADDQDFEHVDGMDDEDEMDGLDKVEDGNDEDDEEDEDDGLDDSEIPHCRGAHLASLFVRTLFRTIRREWGHMDKYRVDKFYTLMRLVLEQMFIYMAQRHWNLGIIRLFNDTLVDEILTQTPNGLRNHLIDITLEELAKVNATVAPIPLTEATFFDCLEPYLFLAQTGGSTGGRRRAAGRDDQIQARVLDRILVRFLNDYSVVSDNYNPDHVCDHHEDQKNTIPIEEQRHHLVFDQVHVGSVAKALFDMASDGTITLNCYRKSLYDMHKVYVKRLNLIGRDVALDVEENGDDEEDDGGDVDDENEEDVEEQEEDVEEQEEEENEENGQVPKSQDKQSKKSGRGQSTPDSDTKKTAKNDGKSEATEQLKATIVDEKLHETMKSKSSKKKEKKRKRDLERAAIIEKTPAIQVENVIVETSAKAKTKLATIVPTAPEDSMLDKKKKEKKQKRQKLEVDEADKVNDSSTSFNNKKVDKVKKSDQILQSPSKQVTSEMDKKQQTIEKTSTSSKTSASVNTKAKDKPNTPESPNATEPNEAKQKKRKRKKKNQQADGADVASVNDDVVVTISLAEQKQAAQAAAVVTKPVNNNNKQQSTEIPSAKAPNSKKMKSSEKSKRVSFGKLKSKSYMSSITSLRTMDPPPLVKKSPEEGILLNKDADPMVRRDLLDKNLLANTKPKSNNRPQQIQRTKSVWTAPMTMTRKNLLRQNPGPNVRRDLPKTKRRKASDYF